MFSRFLTHRDCKTSYLLGKNTLRKSLSICHERITFFVFQRHILSNYPYFCKKNKSKMIDPNELFYPVSRPSPPIDRNSIYKSGRKRNSRFNRRLSARIRIYTASHRQQRLGHSTRLHPGASHCFTEFTPRYRTAGRRVARTSI